MHLLYIHGFNASGNATKAKIMMRCLDDYQTMAPTFDYQALSPYEVMEQLRAIIQQRQPKLIVGSSLGGYYAIVCAARFSVPILAVNPCTHPIFLIENLVKQAQQTAQAEQLEIAERQLERYRHFQNEVFEKALPEGKNLNFALATDDELLGDHHYLESKYPAHHRLIYKDDCGHHFTKFEEIMPFVRELLQPNSAVRVRNDF